MMLQAFREVFKRLFDAPQRNEDSEGVIFSEFLSSTSRKKREDSFDSAGGAEEGRPARAAQRAGCEQPCRCSRGCSGTSGATPARSLLRIRWLDTRCATHQISQDERTALF